MKKHPLLFAATIMGCVLPLHAATVQSFRANITGGGGDGGKCTIEVEVDDSAEVEISGDQGIIRTLSGSPSRWRRFQCTSPLPRNPGDFRFRGIDGRGEVRLIREPLDGGRAIVSIRDSQGGREGYTFDLEWRGGDFGRGGDPGRGGFPGGGYPDRRNQGGNRFTAAQAINVCKDAARDKAQRDYGVREVDFLDVNPDNNPGRNDWVVGSFEGRGRGNRDRFTFACSVNFNNGRVRSVEVRRR
jgi:hypothetical protein